MWVVRPAQDAVRCYHRPASWAGLTTHLAPELAGFAQENKEWLRVYQLPAYAPDMNPAEGIWSLLKRSITNFAAADQAWSASSSAS
jgi:transposase